MMPAQNQTTTSKTPPRRPRGSGSEWQDQRGTWHARKEIAPNPRTGKRRMVEAQAPTKTAARQRLQEKIKRLQREGDMPLAGTPTLDEWMERWLNTIAPNVKPRTLETYRSDCNTIRSVIGGMRLDRITPATIDGMCAKRWIQQSLTWTGGNLPITFEDDMAGTYERNIKGAELKLIGDLLINLTEVQNGPDIRFQPRLTTDGLGYEWLLKTGKPRLTGNTTTIWDTSLPGNTVSDLTISQDANDLANIVWETGGAASDQAIIERATDHSFTGLGFPLLEKVESLSSSVTDPKTALAHAVETIRTSTRPLNTWQFSVQRDQRLGEYDVGHDCGLIIRNDQFGIPDGLHKLRIMTLRGSSDSDKIEITTGAFNE